MSQMTDEERAKAFLYEHENTHAWRSPGGAVRLLATELSAVRAEEQKASAERIRQLEEERDRWRDWAAENQELHERATRASYERGQGEEREACIATILEVSKREQEDGSSDKFVLGVAHAAVALRRRGLEQRPPLRRFSEIVDAVGDLPVSVLTVPLIPTNEADEARTAPDRLPQMTINKYIAVYATENSDIYHEEFDDLEEARKFIDSIEDKALLIRCEGVCIESGARISVEDYT